MDYTVDESRVEFLEDTVGKKIRKFGLRSLEKAREYVATYPQRQLVIFRGPDNRYWVCSKEMARRLEQQGMRLVFIRQ